MVIFHSYVSLPEGNPLTLIFRPGFCSLSSCKLQKKRRRLSLLLLGPELPMTMEQRKTHFEKGTNYRFSFFECFFHFMDLRISQRFHMHPLLDTWWYQKGLTEKSLKQT